MYVIKRLLGVFCSDETPKMSHSFRQMHSMLSTPYGWIYIGSGVVAKMQLSLLILMRVARFGDAVVHATGGLRENTQLAMTENLKPKRSPTSCCGGRSHKQAIRV